MRFLLLLMGLATGYVAHAQCLTNVDFNTWTQTGQPANGNWVVPSSGTFVRQLINGDPTFFVSPDTFINVRINGRIRVEDNGGDDDWVGFVFGYSEPATSIHSYDLWLLDWKANWQFKNGQTAEEGFSLCRARGTITPTQYPQTFWGHNTTPQFQVAATNYGSTMGWQPNTDYDFTLIYTSTRTTVLVDGDTIIDLAGCFEPGRFGFYNHSQRQVRYSDFSYTLLSNFEPVTYDVCLGNSNGFLFTDSSCVGTNSAVENISSWQWDFGDGNTSTQINPNHTYTGPGIYPVELIVTDDNGCMDTVVKDITVHALPEISLSGADSTLCPGDSIPLVASGGTSYQWSPPTGLSDPHSPSPRAAPNQSTTYQLTVTDPFGCESDTSFQIPVMAGTAGPDLGICIGDSIQLQASGGTSYLWQSAPTLSNQNLPNPWVKPASTTRYHLTVSDTTGCTLQDSVQVTVHLLPITSVTTPDPYVCSGGPTTLTASGGTQYQWTPGNTLSDSTIASPFAFPVNLTNNVVDSTWYYVTVTDQFGCVSEDSIGLEVRLRPIIYLSEDTFRCPGDSVPLQVSGGISQMWSPAAGLSNTDQQDVWAFPDTSTLYYATITAIWGCTEIDSVWVRVIAPEAGRDTNMCRGDTLSLQGSGGELYQWSPATGLSDPTVATPLAYPDFSTTYLLTVTDSFGCVDTDSMHLTVFQLPTADAGADEAICWGDSLQLMGSGGLRYQWSPTFGFLQSDTLPNPWVWPDSSAMYRLRVQDANGCEDEDEVLLTVHPLPRVQASPDTIICLGESVRLIAQGATQYQWSPATGLSDPFSDAPLLTPDSSRLYRLTGTDINGCVNQDSLWLQVNRLPALQTTLGDSLCLGQSTLLQADGGLRYQWSDGSDQTQLSVMPDQPTVFWVIGFGPDGCPSDTAFIPVYVERNLPLAAFGLSPSEGFAPLSPFWSNQSQYASRFFWDFGNGDTARGLQPDYAFLAPGTYEVRLIVDNHIGCPDTTYFSPVEIWRENLHTPSAFSPNDDGVNDSYFIPSGGFERFEFQVFNRWGRLVYESDNPTFRWDGTANGQPQPEGVYTFRLVAYTFTGVQRLETGTITLLR